MRDAPTPWRLVAMASLGGALELYDFVLYGVWAQAIAAEFFPRDDPAVGLVLAFGVFAIGYLARPLGGLLLALRGDRRGRRGVFLGSLAGMSAATLLIALLPGYATLGLAAPMLLVALRLAQGFCLGGELSGAIVYAAETAPERAGLVCGVMCACLNGGVLLATGLGLGLRLVMPDGWGWRIGFLAGAALGLAGLLVRRQLAETPAFVAQRAPERTPLRALLRGHGRALLSGILVCAGVAGFNGLVFVHLPVWLAHLGHGRTQAVAAQAALLAAEMVAIVAAGAACDRIPARRVLGVAYAALLLGAIPLYLALPHGLLWPLAGAALAGGAAAGAFAVVTARLFPTAVRFSGVALSYNLSFTALSGLAPLAATALVAVSGWDAAPGLYLALCAALGLLGLAVAPPRLTSSQA